MLNEPNGRGGRELWELEHRVGVWRERRSRRRVRGRNVENLRRKRERKIKKGVAGTCVFIEEGGR